LGAAAFALLARFARNRLFGERGRQRRRHFLQRVVPEIAFRREACEAVGQAQLVWRRGQSANLERQLFRRARADVIRKVAKVADLFSDWLLAIAPIGALLLSANRGSAK
jgi:hypothetical protein